MENNKFAKEEEKLNHGDKDSYKKREANNKEMWERSTGDKLLERKKGQGSSRRDDGRREKK